MRNEFETSSRSYLAQAGDTACCYAKLRTGSRAGEWSAILGVCVVAGCMGSVRRQQKGEAGESQAAGGIPDRDLGEGHMQRAGKLLAVITGFSFRGSEDEMSRRTWDEKRNRHRLVCWLTRGATR
jgi:hypothetical protein